jgi:hypothetical protein
MRFSGCQVPILTCEPNLKSELFMVEGTLKTKGNAMTQVHKRFTTEQAIQMNL